MLGPEDAARAVAGCDVRGIRGEVGEGLRRVVVLVVLAARRPWRRVVEDAEHADAGVRGRPHESVGLRPVPPAAVGLEHRPGEVFTDPPYTLAGQLLFVHRAVWALKMELGASLYLVGSTTYLTRAHLEAIAVFLRAATVCPVLTDYWLPRRLAHSSILAPDL